MVQRLGWSQLKKDFLEAKVAGLLTTVAELTSIVAGPLDEEYEVGRLLAACGSFTVDLAGGSDLVGAVDLKGCEYGTAKSEVQHHNLEKELTEQPGLSDGFAELVLEAAGQLEGSSAPDVASAAPEASLQSEAPSGTRAVEYEMQYHSLDKELTVQAVLSDGFVELGLEAAGQVEGSGFPDEASAAPEARLHSESPSGTRAVEYELQHHNF